MSKKGETGKDKTKEPERGREKEIENERQAENERQRDESDVLARRANERPRDGRKEGRWPCARRRAVRADQYR